jgi:hypothetical protein
MPMGREVPKDQQTERPHFTLEPIHNYDVPVITKIGVVATQSYSEIEGYAPVCDEYLQEALKGIEGVEVVYIPYDSTKFGGAVEYDRAAWLCGEFKVDALLMTDLTKLELPGGSSSDHLSRTARILLTVKSTLIEGVGGSVWWEKAVDDDRTHNNYEIAQGQKSLLQSDIKRAIMTLIDDMKANGKLQGGHVD